MLLTHVTMQLCKLYVTEASAEIWPVTDVMWSDLFIYGSGILNTL